MPRSTGENGRGELEIAEGHVLVITSFKKTALVRGHFRWYWQAPQRSGNNKRRVYVCQENERRPTSDATDR
jgi:hypothetical protein